MGADSGIEWTDDTVNFWWGCDEVSEACDNCYARRIDAAQARRFRTETHWNEHPRRLRVENAAAELARNNRRSGRDLAGLAHPRRRRQFINSMSDFFEQRDELIYPRLRALDAIRQATAVDCLLLTKRPHLVLELLKETSLHAAGWKNTELAEWLLRWLDGQPPANVQIGTTAENQTWLDARLPHLLAIPARVRFLSCEPLLGPLSICQAFDAWLKNRAPGTCVHACPRPSDYLHQVIAGGESDDRRDNHARPMHPVWPRQLRDECRMERIPFFFKQWGDWIEVLQLGGDCMRLDAAGRDVTELYGMHDEADILMRRVFKAAAGRLLDGQTWDELPRAAVTGDTHA